MLRVKKCNQVYIKVSVSKPTVIFGMFEVGKAETLEYRDEQTVKASLLFLNFSVSQFIQSQNY